MTWACVLKIKRIHYNILVFCWEGKCYLSLNPQLNAGLNISQTPKKLSLNETSSFVESVVTTSGCYQTGFREANEEESCQNEVKTSFGNPR